MQDAAAWLLLIALSCTGGAAVVGRYTPAVEAFIYCFRRNGRTELVPVVQQHRGWGDGMTGKQTPRWEHNKSTTRLVSTASSFAGRCGARSSEHRAIDPTLANLILLQSFRVLGLGP